MISECSGLDCRLLQSSSEHLSSHIAATNICLQCEMSGCSDLALVAVSPLDTILSPFLGSNFWSKYLNWSNWWNECSDLDCSVSTAASPGFPPGSGLTTTSRKQGLSWECDPEPAGKQVLTTSFFYQLHPWANLQKTLIFFFIALIVMSKVSLLKAVKNSQANDPREWIPDLFGQSWFLVIIQFSL